MIEKPIEITEQSDAYRLRCPRGHQVAPTNCHWWCRACANSHDPDAEPELDAAIDAETGREVTRDEVTLDFDVPGVYYA